jgi:hypothetical protein
VIFLCFVGLPKGAWFLFLLSGIGESCVNDCLPLLSAERAKEAGLDVGDEEGGVHRKRQRMAAPGQQSGPGGPATTAAPAVREAVEEEEEVGAVRFLSTGMGVQSLRSWVPCVS